MTGGTRHASDVDDEDVGNEDVGNALSVSISCRGRLVMRHDCDTVQRGRRFQLRQFAVCIYSESSLCQGLKLSELRERERSRLGSAYLAVCVCVAASNSEVLIKEVSSRRVDAECQ